MVTNLGDVVDGLVRSRGIEASSVRNSFEMNNLVPRALFPGLGGGAGKGPGIGRPIRHFDWLIDLGNSCKKMAR